jgi:hypothetical protein
MDQPIKPIYSTQMSNEIVIAFKNFSNSPKGLLRTRYFLQYANLCDKENRDIIRTADTLIRGY